MENAGKKIDWVVRRSGDRWYWEVTRNGVTIVGVECQEDGARAMAKAVSLLSDFGFIQRAIADELKAVKVFIEQAAIHQRKVEQLIALDGFLSEKVRNDY